MIVVVLLLHHAGVTQPMSKLALGTTTSSSAETSSSAPGQAANVPDHKSAATGYTFTGEAIRTFPSDQLKFASPSKTRPARARLDPWCARWGVVTTIFEPSEAVHRWVKVEGWCLVIVGDRKSPKVYDTRWKPGEGNDAVVYLSPADQEALRIEFVNTIPWNNFGRKNVGFLYAIMHGATVIWDFDDDNMLKFWIPGAAPEGAPSIDAAVPTSGHGTETIQVIEPHNHSFPSYNPYPALGAPTLPSWPRGLPLPHIKLPDCYDTQTKTRGVSRRSIAVLQSLADHQPDLDAIYRITMPIPFSFNRSDGTKPLLVPTGVLTPYNAQATLHFEAGFWALLLPITVHGRVSDIWRSYFAQRLFWDVGLQVGFLARPLVVQDRNPHSNLGDLDAERDLYQKSEHLINFLGKWKGKGKTLITRVEELWVTLYEHQYIEVDDVVLLQQWLQSLLDVGYTFPELVNSPPSSFSPVYQPSMGAKGEDREDAHMDDCKTASLTFWTSDLYENTSLNIPSALASMGHKVVLAGRKQADPSVSQKKGFSVYQRLSNVISKQYVGPSTRLTEKMVKNNFEFYKDDGQIASTDAFICTLPASMCEMWMPFNKTIMFLPAHRYNLGRCSKEGWDRLNEHISALVSMDYPKHIIGAEGVYDREYLRHYTGVDPLLLNSVSDFYTTKNTYAPTRNEILAFGTWDDRLQTEILNFQIKSVDSMYPRHQPSDLVSHRAAVILPNFVTSYTLTELYSLGIPLFIPSMTFIRNVRRTVTDERSSLSGLYCKNPRLKTDMQPHPSSTHPYSPNIVMAEDKEAELYWLQFADFFNWPHITYFDDFKDLERRLGSVNSGKIHDLMMNEVEYRKKELLLNLCKASKKIHSGRMVPKDYNIAINLLYGVSVLQAK